MNFFFIVSDLLLVLMLVKRLEQFHVINFKFKFLKIFKL